MNINDVAVDNEYIPEKMNDYDTTVNDYTLKNNANINEVGVVDE